VCACVCVCVRLCVCVCVCNVWLCLCLCMCLCLRLRLCRCVRVCIYMSARAHAHLEIKNQLSQRYSPHVCQVLACSHALNHTHNPLTSPCVRHSCVSHTTDVHTYLNTYSPTKPLLLETLPPIPKTTLAGKDDYIALCSPIMQVALDRHTRKSTREVGGWGRVPFSRI